MSQDDFNLHVFDPKQVPASIVPTLLAAPEAGSFVDTADVLQRLADKKDALLNGHPNGRFAFELDTQLPDTVPLPPDQAKWAVLDKEDSDGVWFDLQVLDADLVGKAYDGLYAISDAGCLLSARIRLKKMITRWKNLDGSPGQITKWRLAEIGEVRPHPKDEVHTWLPVCTWVDDVNYPVPGSNPPPQPVLSLGWTKQTMERLCIFTNAAGRQRNATVIHGTTRGLLVRLFSAQDLKAHGPTGRALTTGQRVASFHAWKTELEVDLTTRIAAWRKTAPPPKKPKPEPTALEKLGFVLPQHDDTSRPIGTTGYRLLVRPPLTRVAVGHSMRFVCQADPTLRPLQFMSHDWLANKVEFGLFDEERNLVAELPAQLGRLSQDGQEQLLEGTAPTDGAVEIPQDHFVVRTFQTPGRFAMACGVTLDGSEEPIVAIHEVEVCSVDAILSTSMEKGLAEGMPDPGQAYQRTKDYCAALEVGAAGAREQSLMTPELEESHRQEVAKLTDYAQALGDLLLKTELALQPFPGAWGLPYLSDLGAIKCETWLCPSGKDFGPISEKIGGKLGWAKTMLELKVCLAQSTHQVPDKKVRVKLLDWSDPLHAKFSGVHEATEDDLLTAVRNVIKKWVRDCGHPNGRYRVQVSAPFHLVVELEKTTSLLSELAEWAGYLAAAASVLALCLSGVGAPAGIVAAATLTALFAGVASSVMSIVDRQQYGALGWTRADMIDLLDIAGSLCSAGATRWAKAAKIAVKAGAAGKAQKFRLYAKIASVGETSADLLQGVLVLEEEAAKLDQLLSASGLTPGERLQKLIKVLGAASNLNVMGLRRSLLELDGIDAAARKILRDGIDKLKDPGHLLTAGTPPTTTTHTNEGQATVTVAPKKAPKRPAAPKLPPVRGKPKGGNARWNGKGYDPPSQFPEVLADRSQIMARAKPGACEADSVQLGQKLFGAKGPGGGSLYDVRPDVLKAVSPSGIHKFARVRRPGQDDLIGDSTLYQFFDTKPATIEVEVEVFDAETDLMVKVKEKLEFKGTPGELETSLDPVSWNNRTTSNATLEAAGLPVFEGTRADLLERLRHLASPEHPFIKLKDQYAHLGPDGLYEAFWGCAEEKPFLDGQTLGFTSGGKPQYDPKPRVPLGVD